MDVLSCQRRMALHAAAGLLMGALCVDDAIVTPRAAALVSPAESAGVDDPALPGGTSTAGALTASLTPDLASPQRVGTPVTWTAMGLGMPARFIYRFSVSHAGAPFRVVRDYGSSNTLVWAPLDEGPYIVSVTVREGFGRSTKAQVSVPFVLTTAVVGSSGTVSETGHPLVALYSAPPCVGVARVGFRASGSAAWQYTNWKACRPGKSVNFHVAGMRARTLFLIRHQTWDGISLVNSGEAPFQTGAQTVYLPSFSVTNGGDATTSMTDDVLFHSMLTKEKNFYMPIATDLWGRVIYYLDKRGDWGIAYPTRLVANGSMLIVTTSGQDRARLIQSDFLGNTLRETNVTRVNEQLTARGIDNISMFHHDAVRLPNGHTLVLAMIERTLTGDTVPTVADLVIDLDPDFQVAWTWNAFDHLDPQRRPVLGETCGSSGYLNVCSPEAIDWLHSNSVNYSPADGNLIVSIRNQDWIIKIRYEDGSGNGDVLWRLGRGGDFTLTNGTGVFPWNSHQHDAVYVGANRIATYDNGNTRCFVSPPGTCNSRGQVYELNEATRVATLILDADLGVYAAHYGSAEMLANGNYHFGSGPISVGPASGDAREVSSTGAVGYTQRVGEHFYRSYRSTSLYVP